MGALTGEFNYGLEWQRGWSNEGAWDYWRAVCLYPRCSAETGWRNTKAAAVADVEGHVIRQHGETPSEDEGWTRA